MPPSDELDPFWSLAVPQPFDTIGSKFKYKKETPYSGSVADVEMSQITNDPEYQMKRARRRTLIKRMVSNQSTNLSPTHSSIANQFFDSQR